ncbi:fucose permease [Thermosporothrix hazakensis]|jgi:MFS family permease|uniref:Fucose permease n=1 Tax=Thermosporothrix hazakensis TaxID=644383 RepID=A0A326U9G7_THEHA|nr:MFS transporter [Thermosporothrix hazakensis]PZW32670.1 fucose permease [Thermosporothrix hazakensis]GCE50022.1 MFS transporter [Thermosporothrix hazakensis]
MSSNQKPPPRVFHARLAAGTLFFANGVGLATWATRIPAVQQDLHLSPGHFGLALWGMAAGAIVAFPFTGWLISRFGSRIVSTVVSLLFCLFLPLPVLAPNLILLWLALFVLGMCNGAMDVSMNAQAVSIEEEYGRPIITSFHGLWSIGSIVGSAIGSVMAAQNIHQLPHVLIIACIIMVVSICSWRWLLTVSPTGTNHPAFALPSKALIGIGIVALCAAVSEGAISDWGAIYLHQSLGTTAAFAAAGFAIFSGAMTVARLTGDKISHHLGAAKTVRIGGIISTLGIALALFVPNPITVVIGFAGVGLGIACSIPLVFSAAGRLPNISSGVALAGVATMSYGGFLAGPPLIGGMAEIFTLRGALGIILLLSILMTVLAYTLDHSARAKKGAATANERTEATIGK